MSYLPALTVRRWIQKPVAARAAVIRLDNLAESGYYLTIMNKRNKFINILVLSIYLFSALLPLLYSTKSVNAEEDYVYAALATVQRSIIEQKLWLISSDEQSSDSPSTPGAQILLKKKRAIAPSFKEIVPKLFSQDAVFPNFDPSFKLSSVLLHVPDNALNSLNGFSYYHSGISPPSA